LLKQVAMTKACHT